MCVPSPLLHSVCISGTEEATFPHLLICYSLAFWRWTGQDIRAFEILKFIHDCVVSVHAMFSRIFLGKGKRGLPEYKSTVPREVLWASARASTRTAALRKSLAYPWVGLGPWHSACLCALSWGRAFTPSLLLKASPTLPPTPGRVSDSFHVAPHPDDTRTPNICLAGTRPQRLPGPQKEWILSSHCSGA